MDALMLPLNWQRVKLGDIAEINPPTIIPNVFYYIDLENVEKGQLLNKQLMTKNKAPSRARRLLSKNDILYQLVRPYQRNNYFFTLNGNYVASTGYAQIRTLQNPSFLYFALHSNYFVNAVLDRCEGTSYPAMSSNELKRCEVILPPLNEQIAIANILSALDRYLCALDALILKKEGVKKALSFELLSQRKRLRGFNQAWQRVRLGDILELLTDYHANGSYELLKNNVTLLKHVDFAIMIRTTNFENNDFKNDLIYINKKAYEFLSKSKVFAGDILVNKIANAGTAYFMPKLNQPVSLGMNLFLLRIKPNYNNFFIFKQIANYERVLKTFANGSATKTITKNVIKNLLIPLPPLNEQIAIANILSALDNEIISLKNKKRQFENIKKALNHDLMSTKIRVLKK